MKPAHAAFSQSSCPRSARALKHAALIDLGCLATQAILAERPDAELVFECDLRGTQGDTARPQIFPIIAANNHQIAAPFEAAWYAGRAETEPGERGTSLSAMMYTVIATEPSVPIVVAD